MSENIDHLYELLPAIYRLRDAEQGYPLQALLRVIDEQVAVVREDIDQLYENWFVETAQDWAVPYIGDLVGYQPVFEAGEPGSAATAQGQARNKILIPRREVANTLRNRRRKGTLALLELLASDVAGWPARAVEFYKLLGWTQNLNHQPRAARPDRRSAPGRSAGPARRPLRPPGAHGGRAACRQQAARRGATTSPAWACSSGGSSRIR